MKSVEVLPVPELGKRTVEWLELGRVVLSQGHRLFVQESLRGPVVEEMTVPRVGVRSLVSSVRPMQRLLRFFFFNCIPLADGKIFTTFGRDLLILGKDSCGRIEGLSRGFRVLRGSVARDPAGDLFFGEYLANPARTPVKIFRLRKGTTRVEVAYVFPANTVRHVHGVYHDPFSGELWCLTGDRGAECKIIKSADGFRTVEVVGEGDESWRSVSMQFTDRSVFYATDAEFEQNRLFRLDRRTGVRTELCLLDGPVYYSTSLENDLFFGVAAELCPSQVGRDASLWHVADGTEPARVWSAEKDWLSPKYFLRGMLHFSQGPGVDREAFFQAIALKGVDARSFRIRMGTEND